MKRLNKLMYGIGKLTFRNITKDPIKSMPTIPAMVIDQSCKGYEATDGRRNGSDREGGAGSRS